MNPYVKSNADGPPPRHPLGLWLNYRKFASSVAVPSRHERLALRDGQFFGVVIDWALPGNGADQFKGVAPGRFVATHLVASITDSVFDGIRGYQFMLYDPIRKIQLTDQPVMAQNGGGSAAQPFYLKHLYTFEPRTPILAQVTNLAIQNSSGQIVIYGYITA